MSRNSPNAPRYCLQLDGGASLPIVVRKRRGTRRMIIRYQPVHHALSLTLPSYVSIKQGLDFVAQKRAWIEQEMQRKKQPVPFAHGQMIPVLGKNLLLTHTGGRGVVTMQGEALHVPGDNAFMTRRVREWLKQRLREEITTLAQAKAQATGKTIGKITLRDTASTWGSCNARGHLSFCWRLVFAPYEVLDYLVAHEVAHLSHLNHSAKFWAVTAQLCPNYPQAQAWLKQYGNGLYVYGQK